MYILRYIVNLMQSMVETSHAIKGKPTRSLKYSVCCTVSVYLSTRLFFFVWFSSCQFGFWFFCLLSISLSLSQPWLGSGLVLYFGCRWNSLEQFTKCLLSLILSLSVCVNQWCSDSTFMFWCNTQLPLLVVLVTFLVMVMLQIRTSGDCCLNENPSQFLFTHSVPHSNLDSTYQNRREKKWNWC